MIDARFTYCGDANVWYFDLKREAYGSSVPDDKLPNYILDFSVHGNLLGVEVLNPDMTLRELSALLMLGKL